VEAIFLVNSQKIHKKILSFEFAEILKIFSDIFLFRSISGRDVDLREMIRNAANQISRNGFVVVKFI